MKIRNSWTSIILQKIFRKEIIWNSHSSKFVKKRVEILTLTWFESGMFSIWLLWLFKCSNRKRRMTWQLTHKDINNLRVLWWKYYFFLSISSDNRLLEISFKVLSLTLKEILNLNASSDFLVWSKHAAVVAEWK